MNITRNPCVCVLVKLRGKLYVKKYQAGNWQTFYRYYSNIFRSPRDASSPGSHRFEDALPAALEFKEESKYEIN